MGPNLLSAETGAALEVRVEPASAGPQLARWSREVRTAAQALGWGDLQLQARQVGAMAYCTCTAPVDQLMTATDLLEQAWVVAEGGTPLPLDQLQRQSAAERNPRLVALQMGARRHGVVFAFDDERASVGSGAGARCWPLDAIPDADEVPWNEVRDVPLALVTGSNGKTTTARLLAAMYRATGRIVGISGTDGVSIDDDLIAEGDYSGPTGARLVLRDARLQAAVLETARGGLLRRGLGVSRADVAVITNVAADHFGEYGVHDLATLADVKLIVARALDADGLLVLNADDPMLRAAAARCLMPICWFSLQPDEPFVLAHLADGGDACLIRDGELVLHQDGSAIELGSVASLPIAHRGAATHNIANALAASAAAAALGVPVTCIRTALATFGSHERDNRGRLDIRRHRGITAILDYAHNPAGITALCEVARTLPAVRRLLVLGQAGNRDDAALADLARAAWTSLAFDRVIVKRMDSLRRGRPEGETEAILLSALRGLGADERQLELADSELEAVQRAVAWAAPGDLLVLPVHAERAAVLRWLEEWFVEGE